MAILGLESETVAGHTCKVLILERPIDVERLRAEIGSRLDQAPELSLRLQDLDGATCWTPTEIDLSEHVVVDSADAPLRDAELLVAVARVFECRLDRTRPLWRIDVVPALAGGGSALIWTLHHALADGTTAMRIGREALWVEDDSAGPPARRPRSAPSALQGVHRRTQELLTIAREAPHLWHHSPFRSQIDARRRVAFASSDLGRLREAAATSCAATVNDAVLTVVGGGLRRWLEEHHDRLGPVRVKVPVSLHGSRAAHDPVGPSGSPDPHDAEAAEAGNRDSFFYVDVPLTPADPLARLDSVHRATKVRKQGHDAERLDAFTRELGAISPRLRGFADRVMASPSAFALNVSNVRGPSQAIRVVGSPARALYSIAEIGQRHALRAAVVSYAGTLRFGLCADPSVVEDVDSLAAEIEADAEELIDAAARVH